jgi:hypothetical protein
MSNWNINLGSRCRKRFRNKVAERFNCTSWESVRCCKCHRKANIQRKRIIEVHHVYASIEYPELRLDINYVVPLCSKCHDIFHARFDQRIGRFIIKVATAEDLQKYLRLKANDILTRIK